MSLRKFLSEIGRLERVDEVRPRLEVGVVCDAALERDCVVLRLAGALALVGRVAALAVDDRGRWCA